MKKQYFYGIYGIRFVWHGEWSDPELIWHGQSFNYNDLEEPLWQDFLEEFPDAANCTDEDEEHFAKWVKENASLAREYLQNLMDCKCFYGTHC